MKVIATCYNSTSHVTEYDYTFAVASDVLTVNATAPFDLRISSNRVPFVSSYSLTAESVHYSIVPEFSSWHILIAYMFLLGGMIFVIKEKLLKQLV